MAIAPTASISIICGGTSPGIEPTNSNMYVQDTLTGSFTVKNKYLFKWLEENGMNNSLVLASIRQNQGSIQQLKSIPDDVRNVFKTAFEIDQMKVIQLSAARTKYIDQAQSLNIFVEPTVTKAELNKIHFQAWKMGIKSLYYLRTKTTGRANIGTEECEVCQ